MLHKFKKKDIKIHINIAQNKAIKTSVFIKLEYLNHKYISGNKLRKLKYNLIEAKRGGYKSILTFGGAFSNHIAAVASAGAEFGFETIGVIRGEEIQAKIKENATLSFAENCGMQFKFVSRKAYREKTSKIFIDKLKEEYKDFYLLPEGGTNELAVRGCEEILSESDLSFNYVCCPVGTGGTLAGIINCSKPSQQVLGFPALKGGFLKEEIGKFTTKSNWELITDYNFGGYAKINSDLVSFINEFKNKYNIPLDPIYTSKMMYGIFDLLEKDYFPKDSKILAIHTGGLQGIVGMNKILEQKKMPLIHI